MPKVGSDKSLPRKKSSYSESDIRTNKPKKEDAKKENPKKENPKKEDTKKSNP